ncbi:endonuclease/exonuclease/phosphatase family protein [Priestia megaterium]|nr:endonuclease/exonuclease/phosphatase family protein [Priestia megaterium]
MITINVLYWNIKNNVNVVPLLSQLCKENSINVLILSETKGIDPEYIVRKLNDNDENYSAELPMPGNRTYLFHSLKGKIVKVKDGKFYSAFKIIDSSSLMLLISLHLPSRLYKSDDDIGHEASLVRRDIEKLEEEFQTNRTMVVGDFNLNPFSKPMVASYGFNAIMCKETALKLTRTVDREPYKYFFNPMWSLHGNLENQVLGSYYHHKSPVSYVWNMFDQVIIRPSLIELFDFNELEILHKINETSILKSSGRPNDNDFSDHLPLKFKIKVEENLI